TAAVARSTAVCGLLGAEGVAGFWAPSAARSTLFSSLMALSPWVARGPAAHYSAGPILWGLPLPLALRRAWRWLFGETFVRLAHKLPDRVRCAEAHLLSNGAQHRMLVVAHARVDVVGSTSNHCHRVHR